MRREAELVPYAAGELPGEPLLVLAPHPDDEVFGCGGLLALAAREGRRIVVAVVTEGGAQGEPEVRRNESREAARRLGTPEPEFLGFPDRGLDPADPALGAAVRELLFRHRPRVVLIPAPSEVHPDHRALALAAYRTVQEAEGLDPGLRLAAYEVSAVLRPNLLVDVTAVWEDVLAAAKAFASQLGAAPYLETLEGIASARRLTLPPSVRRAEAYHVVDLSFVRTRSALEWAAAMGPSAGLEVPAWVAPPAVLLLDGGDGSWVSEVLKLLAAEETPPAEVLVVGGGIPEAAAGAARRLGAVAVPRSVGDPALAHALRRVRASHVVVYHRGESPLPGAMRAFGRALGRGAALAAGAAVTGTDTSRTLVPAPPGAALAAFLAAGTLPCAAVAVPRQGVLEALTARGAAGPEEALAYTALAGAAERVAEPVCRTDGRSELSPDPLRRLLAELDREAVTSVVTALVREAARRAGEAAMLAERAAVLSQEHDRLRAELGRVRAELGSWRQEAQEAEALRERIAALERELEEVSARGFRGLLRRR